MSSELPIVLITPEAKFALEAEAERAGMGGDVVGGLLFGYSPDERQRVVVSSVRPRPEIGFGTKDFCLDQSRTSQQLKEAQKFDSQAHYCGVWYVHRTPSSELTDAEWVQAQGVLEDPDYQFKDLVCLVVCLYFGELNTYALSFNLYQSARGQLPTLTDLRLTSEVDVVQPKRRASSRRHTSPDSADWHQVPDVAGRLNVEAKFLERKYNVESAVAPDGKMVFRLMPKGEREDLVFYIACEAGFPDKAPTAFLAIRGDRYPLLSPALSEWTADCWLVDVADDLVRWQARLLDQQIEAAEEALARGDHEEASDLLAMVLLIDPRQSGAARLLAQAEAMAEVAQPEAVPELPAAPAQVSSAQASALVSGTSEWYKAPGVARRLRSEYEQLARKYRVESAVAPDERIVFRLMPRELYEDMVFYLACEPGFPDKVPTAFLVVRGDRYPLLSPGLSKWTADTGLTDVADDVIAWQVRLLDQQVAAARGAMAHGEYKQASDVLAMVLLIDPRKPGVADLLNQAQSLLEAK